MPEVTTEQESDQLQLQGDGYEHPLKDLKGQSSKGSTLPYKGVPVTKGPSSLWSVGNQSGLSLGLLRNRLRGSERQAEKLKTKQNRKQGKGECF